jgi:hypothetical protein
MPDIQCIRAEIERMRIQMYRQRGEIRQLQEAGITYCLGRSAAASNAREDRSSLC